MGLLYVFAVNSTGKGGRWRNSNYIIFFLFPANKTGLSRLKTSMERYFGGIRLIKCHSAPNVFFLYRSKCTAPSRAPTDKNTPWGTSGRPWTRFLNVLIVNSNLICHFLFLFFVASSHCGSLFSVCFQFVFLVPVGCIINNHTYSSTMFFKTNSIENDSVGWIRKSLFKKASRELNSSRSAAFRYHTTTPKVDWTIGLELQH